MTTTATTGRPVYKTPENKADETTLHVVALYDGFAAGIRVREAFAWLSQMLAPGIRMEGKAWNFDTLAREDFRPTSLHEAENANLLVVAAHGDERLPVQVATWLERCLSRSRILPAALAGLGETIDGDEAIECLLYQDLARITERWGVEFIPGAGFESCLDAANLMRVVDQEELVISNPYLDRFAWCQSEAPISEFYAF